jgi:hypothetical protein
LAGAASSNPDAFASRLPSADFGQGLGHAEKQRKPTPNKAYLLPNCQRSDLPRLLANPDLTGLNFTKANTTALQR